MSRNPASWEAEFIAETLRIQAERAQWAKDMLAKRCALIVSQFAP
jgi:hypothetical protein